MQLDLDELRRELTASREALAQAISNKGEKHVSEVQSIPVRDNVWTKLTQARNFFYPFL